MSKKMIFKIALFLLAAVSAQANCTEEAMSPDTNVGNNIITRYYPNLSCGDLKKKFTDPKTGGPISNFQFFRTAVPWYWDFLKSDAKCADGKKTIQKTVLDELLKNPAFSGFCAGDGHPENFAVQYPPSTNAGAGATFAINDPDDAGGAPEKCPVVADFVRYLLSIQMFAEDDAAISALIDQYVASLGAEKAPAYTSQTVQKYLKKDLTDAEAIAKALEKFNAIPSTVENLCPGVVMDQLKDETLLSKIQPSISDFVGKDKVTALSSCGCKNGEKAGGGSGGVGRYEVKCLYDGKNEIAFTLKGTQKNASAFYSENEKEWDPHQRYEKACTIERGKDARVCRVLDMKDYQKGAETPGTFWVRLKKEKNIDLKDFTAEERLNGDPGTAYKNPKGLYVDQVNAIARMHRSSLGAENANLLAGKMKAMKDELHASVRNVFLRSRETAKFFESSVTTNEFIPNCEKMRPKNEARDSMPNSRGGKSKQRVSGSKEAGA